ncbi:MAG: TIR domain-containing protein [Chloroflexota bacterium]
MPDIYNMSDVFISYSRKDSEFVHKLFDDIKGTGKEVWADFEDIPKAADWWNEIKAGIDAADAFVFVISPDSVRSEICRDEIEHAVAANKRILPLLHREIELAEDKEKVHPAISSHNWIFFRESDNYDQAFQTLIESVETDLEHNRTLTRLLVRAKEWDTNARRDGYLLQGEDLQNADAWLSSAYNKEPAPTVLHNEYIHASQNAATQRQRRIATYAIGGAIVSLLLAAFAVYAMFNAQQSEREARNAEATAVVAREAAQNAQATAVIAREDAEESEREARSVALAASASEALASNNPDLALVLAREALRAYPNPDQPLASVQTTLADAAYAPGTEERIETQGVIQTVVYSSDETRYAAGFFTGEICIYDDATHTQQNCLTTPDLVSQDVANAGTPLAHTGTVRWIHMDEAGTRLLSSGEDERVVLWDIDESSSTYGTILYELAIEGINASALTSDGELALMGTESGEFSLWIPEFDTIATVEYVHTASLNVIAISPDNLRAVAGADDGTLIEYDLVEQVMLSTYRNDNTAASIMSAAYHPDGEIVAIGDIEATLMTWQLASSSVIRTYQGHDEGVTAITFAGDGRTMFTSSWDNSIREWDVESGRIVRSFFGHIGGINALSLAGDNQSMVSGSYDTTMRVWQVRPVIMHDQINTNGDELNRADWNEDYIVTIDEQGVIFIYDRNNVDNVLTRQDNAPEEVVSVELHPERAEFVVTHGDCSTVAYNAETTEIIWGTRVMSDTGCRQVMYRPQHDEVLVVATDSLTLLDSRTGELVRTIDYVSPHDDVILASAAFISTGAQLLVGENARSENLHLIDAETGEVIRVFAGHSDGVLSITLAPNNTQVGTGSYDNTVRLWDIATGETVLVYEGHSDRVEHVDFSPDGRSLVSASNDTTVRLWNIRTAETVYTYDLHTERVVTSHFSHDGRQILSASHDGTLIIWNFPQQLNELQEWVVQNRYIRELTCSERSVYLLPTEGTGCES